MTTDSSAQAAAACPAPGDGDNNPTAPPPQKEEDVVTVIITTSPTPSAPSTELLESVFASFAAYCPSLLRCDVIVVLDAFDRVSERERLKKGTVTAAGAASYGLYRENVARLVRRVWCGGGEGEEGEVIEEEGEGAAEYGSTERGSAEFNGGVNVVPFRVVSYRHDHDTCQPRRPKTTFLTPQARLGFGLAVRSALRLVRTPYVWVHQHDWALEASVPLSSMLRVMQSQHDDATSPVRYIGLPSVRVLNYAEMSRCCEYERLRRYAKDLGRESWAVPRRVGEGYGYGYGYGDENHLPDLGEMPVGGGEDKVAISDDNKTVEEGIAAGCKYMPTDKTDHAEDNNNNDNIHLPLTPLFFWFDKPHLCSTAHYLTRIFPSRLALGRGEFIEDKIGARARDQMKAGRWERWATWLYHPEGGRLLVLRHLQGRTWRGREREREAKEMWRGRNCGGEKVKMDGVVGEDEIVVAA